jgi:hypothetical protein
VPVGGHATDDWLLLVPPLNAGLPQQLAVLLLGHPLTALLDDGAHETILARRVWELQA